MQCLKFFILKCNTFALGVSVLRDYDYHGQYSENRERVKRHTCALVFSGLQTARGRSLRTGPWRTPRSPKPPVLHQVLYTEASWRCSTPPDPGAVPDGAHPPEYTAGITQTDIDEYMHIIYIYA